MFGKCGSALARISVCVCIYWYSMRMMLMLIRALTAVEKVLIFADVCSNSFLFAYHFSFENETCYGTIHTHTNKHTVREK